MSFVLKPPLLWTPFSTKRGLFRPKGSTSGLLPMGVFPWRDALGHKEWGIQPNVDLASESCWTTWQVSRRRYACP
jgi:hypothetical protein